jgi:hypothetical protein
VADCIAADILLEHMPETDILHGDKGYDSDAPPPEYREQRCRTKHSAQNQPALEELLRACPIQEPQSN